MPRTNESGAPTLSLTERQRLEEIFKRAEDLEYEAAVHQGRAWELRAQAKAVRAEAFK